MPMKFGFELMPVVRSNFLDTKGELFDDEVDKIDRVGLSLLLADFQGPHARGVVNGVMLETTNLFAIFSNECQELDIHLDLMTSLSRLASKPLPGNGDLFVVVLGMNLAHAGPARQSVQAVAAQDTRHSRVRHSYVVVSLKIPKDPHRPEVILTP